MGLCNHERQYHLSVCEKLLWRTELQFTSTNIILVFVKGLMNERSYSLHAPSFMIEIRIISPQASSHSIKNPVPT